MYTFTSLLLGNVWRPVDKSHPTDQSTVTFEKAYQCVRRVCRPILNGVAQLVSTFDYNLILLSAIYPGKSALFILAQARRESRL